MCVIKVVTGSKSSAAAINVGFVPLIDAAPLIVASELGYFDDEGLRVTLHRQIGWGNVRDKLTFGQLDVSHALLGMPPLSALGRDMFIEPLVAIAALGSGGNAISLSRRLTDLGISSAASLEGHIHRRQGRPMVFAHVFSCSTHHYLLRQWLAAARIDPDKDIQLCVLPPPQMVRQLGKGLLDGCCVGEPWNLVAQREDQGTIVAATVDLVPDHPEKVLAVSRRWLAQHPKPAERMVRAVLRGCEFCQDPLHSSSLCSMLSDARYLDLPAELLAQCLAIEVPGSRHRFRGWASESLAPSATHAEWLLQQMIRWGHLPPDTNVEWICRSSIDSGPYLSAIESLPASPRINQPSPEGVN